MENTGRATANRAACSPSFSLRPPASTPISFTPASGMKAWNVPIALDPPPTQAITPSGRRPSRFENLRPRLLADHSMEIANHHRIRMRSQRGAEQVIRIRDVRHPIAHRFADCVLQRAAAAIHAHDFAPSRRMRKTFSRCRRMSSAPM